MTDKELYQQMLHFIECSGYRAEPIKKELKIRLAQPESVPLLQSEPTKIFGPNLEGILNKAGFYKNKEWVGLTDDEIKNSMQGHNTQVDFARAIEAKLKEKNSG